MTVDQAVDIIRQTFWVACRVTAPILIVGLVVGFVVGVFQAATQIQESSLSFVPKVLAIILVVAIGGRWFIEVLMNFTIAQITEMAFLVNTSP